MEKFIASLVGRFEAGMIDRRQFCETVALAATVCAAGSAAQAAPTQGFKILGINHLSYACPDYRIARDWYAKIFNTKVYNDKGTGRANLAFGGPGPGEGSSFMVARNLGNNDKPPQAVIDQVSYTIQNWDDARVTYAMKAAGTNASGRKGIANLLDPYGYPVQVASIDAENPFI